MLPEQLPILLKASIQGSIWISRQGTSDIIQALDSQACIVGYNSEYIGFKENVVLKVVDKQEHMSKPGDLDETTSIHSAIASFKP